MADMTKNRDNKIPLGIIGGLGPMATVLFVEKIIRMTKANEDQDHIGMIIYNCPYIPDRTRHILDMSQPDPFPGMSEIAIRLEHEGVDMIAIPCVTAQYYHERLQKVVSIPVMDGLKETIEYLREHCYEKVGVLATDGTVYSDLLGRKLREANIMSVYPSVEEQKNIMSVIYEGVKAGGRIKVSELENVADSLRKRGAQLILLGCTEISVVGEGCDLHFSYLDILDVMSQRIVKMYAELRPEYEKLEIIR